MERLDNPRTSVDEPGRDRGRGVVMFARRYTEIQEVLTQLCTRGGKVGSLESRYSVYLKFPVLPMLFDLARIHRQ